MPSTLSWALTALLASQAAFAAPSPPTAVLEAREPKVTPVARAYEPPTLMARHEYESFMEEMEISRRSYLHRRSLDSAISPDLLYERGMTDKDSVIGDTLLAKRAACLDSSATDVEINSAFFYGKEGTVVSLCPGAKIKLSAPIFFTSANQELSTEGYPTDDTRAQLTVTGSTQATAIEGTNCGDCDNLTLRNIIVHGSRDTMGIIVKGNALISMGGTNSNHLITENKFAEPRGWSAMHAAEGHELACSKIVITYNEIGPAGHGPTNGSQFKRRDAASEGGIFPPGQWADGISLSCKNATVAHNHITDATDGSIVIFGSVGSKVFNNTIRNVNRQGLGGINLVDYAPNGGDYTDVVVSENTIIADTNFIKAGIAIGGMMWGVDNRTASRTKYGTVINNRFLSGETGYFGYAIGLTGHESIVVKDNVASGASFGGEPSVSCFPDPVMPTPQAFVRDPYTTPGCDVQSDFVADRALVLLICNQPGPIVKTRSEVVVVADFVPTDPAGSTSTSTSTPAATTEAAAAVPAATTEAAAAAAPESTSAEYTAADDITANVLKADAATAAVADTVSGIAADVSAAYAHIISARSRPMFGAAAAEKRSPVQEDTTAFVERAILLRPRGVKGSKLFAPVAEI